MKKGISSIDVRQRNRGFVLRSVITADQASRASVTKEIGLTKMAVSNIVSELIEEGYLTELHAIPGGVGRNPVLLDIAPESPLLAGVYLSRDRLSVILTDLKLTVLHRNSTALAAETAESLRDKLLALTEQILSLAPRRVLGFGVSAIGLLDIEHGVLLNPHNFYGIQNFPIVKLLEEWYELPVFLHNDMKAAALAEKLFGKMKKEQNFIYLGLSNGIGAGIMVDGRLFGSDATGEIGHLSLDEQGLPCNCGRKGCLETYASLPIVLDRLKEACGLPDLSPEEFPQVLEDWRAVPVMEDVMEKLASALIDMVNLMDTDAIIIGHEGCFIPQRYFSLLEDEVNLHMFAAGYKKISVMPSFFGTEAPLFGSVCCVLDALFSGCPL